MVHLDVVDHIGVISLHNPPDNRLENPEFIEIASLNEFINKNGLKALIIKGSGRHFSNGADLDSLVSLGREEKLASSLHRGHALLNYLYNLNIPVIAAIEGVCFGGGLEIALSAHIRVLSERALLAFPETMHSLMPGLAGNYRITSHLSMGKSIELILSNKILPAEQAVKEGIGDFLCESGQSFDYAMQLARRMTQDKPIMVIHHVMTAIKNAYVLPLEQAIEEETKLFCRLAAMMEAKDE